MSRETAVQILGAIVAVLTIAVTIAALVDIFTA